MFVEYRYFIIADSGVTGDNVDCFVLLTGGGGVCLQ